MRRAEPDPVANLIKTMAHKSANVAHCCGHLRLSQFLGRCWINAGFKNSFFLSLSDMLFYLRVAVHALPHSHSSTSKNRRQKKSSNFSLQCCCVSNKIITKDPTDEQTKITDTTETWESRQVSMPAWSNRILSRVHYRALPFNAWVMQ